MTSPRSVGVPHDEWRPNQKAMYDIALATHGNGGGVLFGELAVGSGKSAVTTALGATEPTLVHAHTLSLLDQYADAYGFDIVKGKQEYPCAFKKKVADWAVKYNKVPTASDCHFSPMWECPAYSYCEYKNAKDRAKYSNRVATTFKYGALSYWTKERGGILVMDEAHSAAEELIAFNEFAIADKQIISWGLEPFPIVEYGEDNKGAVADEAALGLIKDWLASSIKRLAVEEEDPTTDMAAKARRLGKRFERVLQRISGCDWFLHIEDDRARLRALSAKQVVANMIEGKDTVLAMSGTIGDPAPLAGELGIEDYEAHSFPHPIPAEARPVFDLHCQRMTYHNLKKYPQLYKIQATLIWSKMKDFDPSWRGLVLTSSYYKIGQLAEHLAPMFPDRRWLVQLPGISVNALTKQFVTDVQPGDMAIGTIQGWGSGLDLHHNLGRYTIIAGLPHKSPKDKYEMARRERTGGKRYENWLVYSAVMQADGRTKRGTLDENGEWLKNYTLLADGSATSPLAMKNYSEWFKASIV